MTINKKNALKFWEEQYGDEEYAYDFSGFLMYKYAFGDPDFYVTYKGTKIHCGWNIHHILPKAVGGTDEKTNLICTNLYTNELAADKTTYWINDFLYQVKSVPGSSAHQIVRIV